MSILKQAAQKIPETLKTKEWFDAVHVGLQERMVKFLLWAYGFLLLATVAIIFLQGFQLGGFKLPDAFLKWLGVATIGEMGGLLVMAFRTFFKK